MKSLNTLFSGASFFEKCYFSALAAAILFLLLAPDLISIPIIIWVICWILTGNFAEKFARLKRQPLAAFFIGFYLLYVAGLLWSENLGYAFFDLEIKLSLFIFPLVFATGPAISRQQLLFFIKTFIVGCFLLVLIAFVRSAINYNVDKWAFFYSNLSFLHHPGFLSLYLSFAFFATLVFLQKGKNSFVLKAFLFFLSGLFLLFIFMLAAKSGIVICLLIGLGWVIYLIIRNKKSGAGLLLLVFLSGATFLAVKSFPGISMRFNAFYNQLSEPDKYQRPTRLDTWQSAINVLQERPLIGAGTGDVKDELVEEHREAQYQKAYERKLNAHNQYLQTAATLGALGLLYLLALFFFHFRKAMRQKDLLYLFFMLIFASFCVIESALEVQAGVVFFALFGNLFFFSGYNAKAVVEE